VVGKAIFSRPRDWVDIEAMVAWGTEIDGAEALGWVAEILGQGSESFAHLDGLLGATG
jgi:hypothetical protein